MHSDRHISAFLTATTDNFVMRNEPLMDMSKAVTVFMTNTANYRLSITPPIHTKDFMLKEPMCLNTLIKPN